MERNDIERHETKKVRYNSIDQFRGLTILVMVLVNTIGKFLPDIFQHVHVEKNGLSVADAVLPFFVFVSGMGFRISFVKKKKSVTKTQFIHSACKRNCILIVIGFVYIYQLGTAGRWWEALMVIGISGLLSIPIIGKKSMHRILFAFAYLALFQILARWQFQPLLFVFAFLMGTVAMDWMEEDVSLFTTKSLLWGGGLVIAGLLLSPWLPIGHKGPMNLTSGLFYSGTALVTFLVFYFLDARHIQLPHLTTLGRNAFIIYMLHNALDYIVKNEMKNLVEGDPSSLMVAAIFLSIYLTCYIFARYLEKRKYFITI